MKEIEKGSVVIFSEAVGDEIRAQMASQFVGGVCEYNGCVFAKSRTGNPYCEARPSLEVLQAFDGRESDGCNYAAVNAKEEGMVVPGTMREDGFTGANYLLPISHHIRNIWRRSRKERV
jgi:hypothetical protein